MVNDTPLRILLVEDVPADAELAAWELRREGLSFSRIRVDSQDEFLKALHEFQPDLVISDYSMPEFNGMQALELSLAHNPILPFIILTGAMNEEIAVECMKAGAADYVIKDNLTRLPYAVKGALERHKDQKAKAEAEAALRLSEERFRVALKNSAFVVASTDRDLRYTWIHNPQPDLKGQDVIGKRDDEIQNNYGTRKLLKLKKQVLETGNCLRTEVSFPVSNGIITYDTTLEPLTDDNGQIIGVTSVAVDISERKEYENQLKYLSLHDQLTGLYNRAYFEEEIQRLEGSREYPVTVIMADIDGLKMINDSFGHKAGDELLKIFASVVKHGLRRSDILARVGGDEFSVILPSTTAETGEKVASRIRSAIDRYNEIHKDLPLSVSLGVATSESKNASLNTLYKEADDLMYQDKLYRVKSSRSHITNALMAALAERDYITGGHAKRLASLCQKVGEIMGLSTKQISNLSLLAQVHDLGKVGIPDHILLKDGPLTMDEWKIMRQHPEKGYRIAMSSSDLIPVADFILKHHERWDGTGYPWGLKEEEIRIECRILFVVDAFDAMTSERPYSNPKSKEEALAELQRCAGTQFDPEVVDIFVKIVE